MSKRRRMVMIATLPWLVIAVGSQVVWAWLVAHEGWSFGTRLLGSVVVGVIVGVALGFATGFWLRRAAVEPVYSLEDDELGPGHPLFEILMTTMEKGAVSFEAADTPDGIDIRNVHYYGEDGTGDA